MANYSLIQQFWDDTKFVELQAADGSWLATLPMVYLARSGTNDWQLVYDIAQTLVVEPILVNDQDGNIIPNNTSPPSPGQYTVTNRENQSQSLTAKQGPEGKRRYMPLDDAPTSTVSGSSRSTPRQSQFRFLLAARDSKCVVTGDPAQVCIASHIVPFSRLDVYKRIYFPGLTENSLFEPNMGILLTAGYSRQFDNFKWSIYCRDGHYYFHGPAVPTKFKEYHGTKLKVARLLEWDPQEMPKQIFCHWHWEQTMQAHVRGFAVWPSMEEIALEASVTHGAQPPTGPLSEPGSTTRSRDKTVGSTKSRARTQRGSVLKRRSRG
jgi:hypothetical protein